MATNPETIKEFLIGLGFRVDEHAQGQFTGALESATLKGNLFADTIVEAAKKGIDALENLFRHLNDTAQAMEKLVLNAQRINQDSGLNETTLGLRAFGEALTQIDLNAGSAMETMKGFSRWLAENREARTAYIKEVFKTDITGMSAEDAMMAVFKNIGQSPDSRRLGRQFANVIGMGGITDDMIMALEGLTKTPTGKTLQELYAEERQQQTAAGLTDEKVHDAAVAAELFNSAMGKLNTAFTDLEVDILAYLIPDLKWIDDWLKAHPSPGAIATEAGKKVGIDVEHPFAGGLGQPDEAPFVQKFDPLHSPAAGFFQRLWDTFMRGGLNPFGSPAQGAELPQGGQPGQWLRDQFSGAAKFIGIGSAGAEVSPANPLPVKIMSIDPQAALQSGTGTPSEVPGVSPGVGVSPGAGAGGGGGGGRAGGGFSPIDPAKKFSGTQQDVARILASAFRAGGASEEGIAAMLANVNDESSFRPEAKGGAGEIGLFQFSPTGDEQRRYLAWLKQNHPGANWADPHLQASYQVENLKQNYAPLWKELTTHSPAGWLGAEWVSGYERPAARYEAARRGRYLQGVPSVQHYTGPMGPEAPEDAAGGASLEVSPRAPPPIYRRRNIYHGGQSSEYPSPHETMGGGSSLLDEPSIRARMHASLVDHGAALHAAASFGGGGAAGSSSVSQANTITIHAPDPHTAAAMVGLHLDRNAADIARNLQGSFA